MRLRIWVQNFETLLLRKNAWGPNNSGLKNFLIKFYGSCVKTNLKIKMLESCCSKLLLLSFNCINQRDHPFSIYVKVLGFGRSNIPPSDMHTNVSGVKGCWMVRWSQRFTKQQYPYHFKNVCKNLFALTFVVKKITGLANELPLKNIIEKQNVNCSIDL